MKLTFNLIIDTQSGEFEIVNTETGETKSVEIPKKKTRKVKKVEDTSTEPELILEENKYKLNSAAVELLNIQPEDRLDIKYEKSGSKMTPVIGTNEAFGTKGGNKVTKSFTVACRGKANEELSNYGTKFKIKEHPSKENLFILIGDDVQEKEDNSEDISEEIDIPEDIYIDDLPTDLNLDGLTENPDSTEITSLDFGM